MNEYNAEIESDGVLSNDVATQEFDRLLKAAGVKWSIYEMRHNKRDVEIDRAIIIDALSDGKIVLNDEGFPTVKTSHPVIGEVSFNRRHITGDRLIAERNSGGSDTKFILNLQAQILNIAPDALAKLEGPDAALIDSVWMLFLG